MGQKKANMTKKRGWQAARPEQEKEEEVHSVKHQSDLMMIPICKISERRRKRGAKTSLVEGQTKERGRNWENWVKTWGTLAIRERKQGNKERMNSEMSRKARQKCWRVQKKKFPW